MALHSAGETAEGQGQVTLAWRPRPEFSYFFTTEHFPGGWAWSLPPEPTVSLPAGAPAWPLFDARASPFGKSPSSTSQTSFTKQASLDERLERGNSSVLDLLVVQIVNWPFASSVHAPAPWRWPVDGWNIELWPVEGAIEWVKEAGGYVTTNALYIERPDGAQFSADDVELILEAFNFVLSFAAGSMVGLTMPMGYLGTELVWTRWSRTIVDRWSNHLTWFDYTLRSELGGLAEGWLRRSRDLFWSSVLPRAMRQHLQACDPQPVESAVVMAQVALELLTWAVLVPRQATFARFTSSQSFLSWALRFRHAM